MKVYNTTRTRERTLTQKLRRKRRALSRPKNNVYANLHGYFWIPCPTCGTPFGGHEWQSGQSIKLEEGGLVNQGICPACSWELGEESEQVCKELGHILVPSWLPVQDNRVDEDGVVHISISFSSFSIPDRLMCSRCFRYFDPITSEPLPRSLKITSYNK